MTEALVCMKAAAAARGVSYDTFRKGWRAYVRDGFPAPTSAARPYRWRPSSLTAWQARAEAATEAAVRAGPTVSDVAANQNDGPAPSPAGGALDRERDAVLALMRRGRAHALEAR
jgi:hypothetical protein